MAIVPSGTKRIMVAQTFGPGVGEPTLDKNYLEGNLPATENKTPEAQTDNQYISQIPQNFFDEKQSSPDIAEYVFKKLQKFGYPPRRLEQYEDKIINEKLYPGGLREVSIALPDRYYAKRKRLTDDDISEMVKEIQSEFGLSFVDAERKNKLITMNFTSQSERDEDGGEGEVGDILDDIYGEPSESKSMKTKKTKNKTAYTMAELVKYNRNKIFDMLKKEGD